MTIRIDKSGLTYGWPRGYKPWDVEMNSNLQRISYFAFQIVVIDRNLTAAPVSPAIGDTYIPAAGATAAWLGQDGKLAVWTGEEWFFETPLQGWSVYVDDEATVLRYVDGSWVTESPGGSGGSGTSIQCIPVACGDETSPLTIGLGKVTFRMPYGFSLTGIRASLTSAQSSGNILTIDVNASGASILTTKLTIDNTEKSSVPALTQPAISNSALADNAEVTIDIDQIGDGTATGLKVYLIGSPV